MALRIYYLEEPLSAEDAAFVLGEFPKERNVEQIRIPYVLPPLPKKGLSLKDHQRHEKLLRKNLKAAEIHKDKDKQVVFVAPRNMHWYSVLVQALIAETGFCPFLVQTEVQRQAIGNAGSTRLIDGHALLGFKEIGSLR